VEIKIKLFGNSKGSRVSKSGTQTTQRTAQTTAAAQRRTSAPAQAQSQAQTQARKKKKKSHGGLVAVIIILVIVVAAAAGFGYIGLSAQNSGTIYPNVYIGNVNVGGMTSAQAAAALDGSWEDPYEGKTLVVNFPADKTLEIAAADVVTSDTGTEAAVEQAMSYGRDGGFFANTMTYIKSRSGKTELSAYSSASFDEDKIKELISAVAQDLNANELQNSYTIEDDVITIIKGAKGMMVDEDAIFTLVMEALTAGDFTELEYTPDVTEPEAIDLQTIYDSVFVEPQDAQYDAETMGATEAVTGVSFDMDEAQKLYDEAEDGDKITIPLVYTEPELTAEELEAMLFRDVLATKTTYQASTANRMTNITLAANATNGTILNPGDTFSFNDVVGNRTAAKGYKEAAAYANGEVVQDIGGGICQLSSTLYYCTLYSNLEIVERKCHMYTVSYLPLGLDATVAWGSIDYKFKNNTDYPIKIVSYVTGQNLTVTFYGTKVDDTYVETSYEIVKTIAYDTVEQEDESVKSGSSVKTSGHTGYVVDTYFYLYNGDGTLISKTYLNRSNYSKQNRVILVPVTETPSPSASPSATPTTEPTATPTTTPTVTPTTTPTTAPTATPTEPPIDDNVDPDSAD
jgi:vancomycin resistance protein YoaR